MQTGIFKSFILTISVLGITAMSMNSASAADVIGWMEVNPVNQQIGVTARAFAPAGTKIEYELQVERMGRSGKTSTKQHGKADLEPGKQAQLSTTSVNISPGDRLAILLTIFSDGQVVSSNALHVGPH